jgi:hypothetical protein
MSVHETTVKRQRKHRILTPLVIIYPPRIPTLDAAKHKVTTFLKEKTVSSFAVSRSSLMRFLIILLFALSVSTLPPSHLPADLMLNPGSLISDSSQPHPALSQTAAKDKPAHRP